MPVSFAEKFKTNSKLSEDGVWVDFGDDIEVKVRRLNAKKVQEVRRRLEKPYDKLRRINPDYEIPNAKQEEINATLLAEAVVTDWKGVTDEQGQPLACTPENRLAIFSNPDLYDFVANITVAAAAKETFRSEEIAADTGN